MPRSAAGLPRITSTSTRVHLRPRRGPQEGRVGRAHTGSESQPDLSPKAEEAAPLPGAEPAQRGGERGCLAGVLRAGRRSFHLPLHVGSSAFSGAIRDPANSFRAYSCRLNWVPEVKRHRRASQLPDNDHWARGKNGCDSSSIQLC